VQESERELGAARDNVRMLRLELRSESPPSPDLHYAYQQALQAETVALEKFADAATILNDLVLQSRIPEVEPKRK